MELTTVLKTLVRKFEEQGVNYGLMGGFALGLWGVARSTVDLDFLIDRRSLPKVDDIMKGLGYSVAFSSENVTQYTSPVALFGEVDFLHAFRETSMSMLEHAVTKDALGGSLKVRVLVPEDLIGLKMQAIKNDTSRRDQDMADIKALVGIRSGQIDWRMIEQYASVLDAQELLAELRR